MKRTVIGLLAVCLVTSTLPALAQQPPASQRDECLLASKNCVDQVDDIQKRIRRLNKEIKKGNRAYSPQELKKLQQKLDETRELLRVIETNSGS